MWRPVFCHYEEIGLFTIPIILISSVLLMILVILLFCLLGYFYILKYQTMKTIERIPTLTKTLGLLCILLLASTNGFAQIDLEKRSKLIKPETEIPGDLLWHVKAFHPEAQLLQVKAIDKDGNYHDVKAVQPTESTSLLSVKAIVNDERLPIKMLPKGDSEYYPVKAIAKDGTIIDIKAIAEDGTILNVKGVKKSGNIIHISAVTADGLTFNVYAMSPFGEANVVKGLKMLDSEVEAVINGVSIFAHIKAIKQN